MGCMRGAPLGPVNINNPESLILRSHPAQSCASSFRQGQIHLIDFDLFIFPIGLTSAFLSPFLSSRNPASVAPVTLFPAKFPSSLTLPWLPGSLISLQPDCLSSRPIRVPVRLASSLCLGTQPIFQAPSCHHILANSG